MTVLQLLKNVFRSEIHWSLITKGLHTTGPRSVKVLANIAESVCVCVCVCVCVHVYVVYEDTNLYNDMGMT